MYSSTTVTRSGIKKIIPITTAPLICTYSSKRPPSFRNLVDITKVCACASFTLIVWTSGLHSSLICVSAVFLLCECMKRMRDIVNITLQNRYVQFDWLNMWTGICEYPPICVSPQLTSKGCQFECFHSSGYTPNFISHIIGTRKWTRVHPFWLEFWFF